MRIGVLGAGQLGRMLALAGYPLGLRFRFFDPTPDSPASHLAEQIVGDYTELSEATCSGSDHTSVGVMQQFGAGLDVATYEFENVPEATVRLLAQHCPVYPPPAALSVAQDRLTEKSFFAGMGIPTPPFAPVDTQADLEEAVAHIGLPAVLKTRRFGYDGKGQSVLRTPADIDSAWATLGKVPLILEGFVAFERELSVLAVRGRDGDIAYYPLVENHHRDGILRLSLAPAPNLTPELQMQAEEYARNALTALDYVGVLAIEFFVQGGRLIANEMAPRVHNSGHWTIEGAETSQFENHLRAVAGFPLGRTACIGYSAMINLIGTTPDSVAVLSVPGAHLHLYGKAPRPGRKLGHITVRTDDQTALNAALEQVNALLQRGY